MLGRGERAGRQTSEAFLVVEEEFPRVSGIQDVLGILLRLLREVRVEGRQTRLPFRRQIGAILFKISHRLLEETATDTRERLRVGRGGVGLEDRPEFGIER